ncbi:Hypothetical predicted protein [Olea europaea subsp. europaea]|uniref:Uncharacterized protein n=1 Tax=Olea europaea subsp. europaea TaxID=158383 RepID=A0A8S0TSH2_OLEEU|nr:Hypothetical predicted protein [Olea europaea subsp. europaea]
MSASSKFDLSSGSPDRPLYSSGHRGSYSTTSLDRSGSFCENMENQILSSLPNMTRNSSSVTQGDVTNFFQCVRFDPKTMVVDHKLNRPVAFKRLATAAVGIRLEDSLPGSSKSKPLPSPSSEDLRRLRAGVREGSTKARERVKTFNDCLSVINKCFPTISSRKRSRLDTLSNDRSNALLPTDRSGSGVSISKMGSQSHASMSSFELEQQRSEERTKNAIPNKRTRTSMVDPRANTPARPTGVVDKDREILRFPNSAVINGEDRTSSLTIDGWEKSKMKKKRTGIKTDATASSTVMKPAGSYRESKQIMQPRLPTDARSRMNDSYSFRPGSAGVGKAEAALQQTGLGTRPSSRAEQDNSPLHERRERPTAPEKERLNLKAVNKANTREDLSSGTPTSSSKLNANARASRLGSGGGVSKLSQVVQQATTCNDWEPSNCTSKLPGAVGANNRKRTPSMRSSSPPVPNWVPRPQKMSRTARRTNLVPIIPSSDETLTIDTMPDVMGNERCMPGHSSRQLKLKNDSFSSAAFSESEESGAAEAKPRDKNKKFDEMDEKCGQNVQKMSTLLLPHRKNKAASGEDHGDGVRRQGRSGRGFTSTRSLMNLTVEKHGNVGTTKQIRSSRFGFEKNERAGRPPTRKPSDRKPYTRQKHNAANTAPDFLDDGHEELLAAANAVTNTAHAISSLFWRKMEPLHRLISDTDISYLKDQVNLGSTVDMPALVPLDAEGSASIHNGSGMNDPRREESETKGVELSSKHLAPGASTPKEISLYQTLIAALIPEEGNQELCCSRNEDPRFDVYGSRFEMERDMETDTYCSPRSQNRDISRCSASNGYRINADGELFYGLDHTMPDHNGTSVPDMGILPIFNHLQNGLLPDQMMPGVECSEYQYNKMSIKERLLLEIHSIGLYPDLVPDLGQTGDEEISGDLSRLDEKYQEEVSRKKSLLGRLLTSASEAKELQVNLFEQCALEKLVGMAYEKYMSCWGPNAHGMKSASGKMAKQAALAFVKRTLERCREFDATGKSCFAEPSYKEIFLSGVAHIGDIQAVNSSADNESGKWQLSTSGCSIEVRTSAPLEAQHSPSSNNQEMYSSGVPISANLGFEQTTGKLDLWSNRVKKCELLPDEIVGGTVSSSTAIPSSIGSSLLSSAKGKRSEREGKGNITEVLSRSGSTKIGRPALANVKGERKPKSKPRQKTGQLTASVNGLLGKMSERPKTTFCSASKSNEMSGSGTGKDKNDNMDLLEEPIDLSGLQIPGIGDLAVHDDPAGQEEDLGSWFNNIEDVGLQDHDYMGGLEIPMDDLADLNMMV